MSNTDWLQESTFLETVVNFAGMIGLVALIVLILVLVFKLEKIKNLQTELDKLKRAFDELDGQAKLIVKTDLELHRAEEELDKKIAGLLTLQKLTRLISTTLDEGEIFKRLEEKHITELGFDRALTFSKNERGGWRIQVAIGYTSEEAGRIVRVLTEKPIIMEKVLGKGKIFSSIDTDRTAREIPGLLHRLQTASFICAPIMKKEGLAGVLILGCESTYTPLTEADKDLVYILAAQIGQALENAKLFEETWRSHQELELKVQQRTKELSTALEAIKTISERKTDFISAVSHELRTPLTSIKGYASIIAMGKLGELPGPAKERIEKINKHADNLSQLINNLLDISRIESGRVEMKLERIQIKSVADALADMLAPPMKDKNLTFVIDVPDHLPLARADKSQLERVFINLIGNAIKFTKEGGKITVRARDPGAEMLQIEVSDTGAGIAAKDLHKVFEEFYRVDNEINQQVKGTGLGLPLVKYIVEAHKGKITVASVLGKGTTFTFTMPKFL